MIEPALTPEEWAAGNNAHRVRLESDRPCEPKPLYFPTPEGIAAMNLRGRITWGMVDALRAGADCMYGEDGTAAAVVDLRRATRAVADLIESLLPPRGT